MWCTAAGDAVLDVVANLHPTAEALYLGGTLRHPAAGMYQPQAARHAGFAAAAAAKDKATPYPTRQGTAATCCSCELFGKMGEQFGHAMKQLAYLASEQAVQHGRPIIRCVRLWKEQLSRALARAVAVSLQAAGAAKC